MWVAVSVGRVRPCWATGLVDRVRPFMRDGVSRQGEINLWGGGFCRRGETILAWLFFVHRVRLLLSVNFSQQGKTILGDSFSLLQAETNLGSQFWSTG